MININKYKYWFSFCIAKFLLKGFVAERKGEREEMQDAHVMLDDFQPEFNQVDLPSDV